MVVHIYHCPGPYNINGVMHDVRSHDKEQPLPDKWYYSLKEAAKAGGPKCLVKEKKQNMARVKKMAGLPFNGFGKK